MPNPRISTGRAAEGERKPCVPKRNVYFDAEQYWQGNRAGIRYKNPGKTDDELREIARVAWHRCLDDGVIPAACERCGFHHHPADGESGRAAESAGDA